MAEAPNQPPAPLPTAEEVAAANAATIAKLKSQDAAGDPRPDPLEQKAAGDALDALLKQAEAKADPEKKEEPAVEPKEEPKEEPAVQPKTEETPAAKEAAEKAAAEKAEREQELKKADEFFKDTPSLPQGASVKSHEAFSAIKIKSAQEISRLNAELEKLSKELSTVKETTSKPSPEFEKVRQENEELKKWRAKLDVDFDPKFKEFDKQADENREFIYAQLRKNPNIAESTIDQIKKLGGPDKILMKPVLDALNDTISQRLVEAKLAEIEMAKYKKDQAIASTKSNITEYLASREQELTKAATAGTEDTKKELDSMWRELDWTKVQTPKQGATPEERKAVENHNKFVEGMRKELDEAIKEIHTPKMRATLLTAAAQLFNLQGEYKAFKEKFAALEKENAELLAFKNKVKSATRSRLPESQAPRAGTADLQKPVNIFNTPAADGIDAIAKQVMAERAAKAGQA